MPYLDDLLQLLWFSMVTGSPGIYSSSELEVWGTGIMGFSSWTGIGWETGKAGRVLSFSFCSLSQRKKREWEGENSKEFITLCLNNNAKLKLIPWQIINLKKLSFGHWTICWRYLLSIFILQWARNTSGSNMIDLIWKHRTNPNSSNHSMSLSIPLI